MISDDLFKALHADGFSSLTLLGMEVPSQCLAIDK